MINPDEKLTTDELSSFHEKVHNHANAGACLLDQKVPGWFKDPAPWHIRSIDLNQLDLSDSLWCIFGQMFGSFQRGATELQLSMEELEKHGFTANAALIDWIAERCGVDKPSEDSSPIVQFYYRQLTAEWRTQILFRRDEERCKIVFSSLENMLDASSVQHVRSELLKSVNRGIELLDSRLPHWKDNIDLERLSIADPDWCIIGQLAPARHDTTEKLLCSNGLRFLHSIGLHGWSSAQLYGFNVTEELEAWIIDLLNEEAKAFYLRSLIDAGMPVHIAAVLFRELTTTWKARIQELRARSVELVC